jgi:hypothetical protein
MIYPLDPIHHDTYTTQVPIFVLIYAATYTTQVPIYVLIYAATCTTQVPSLTTRITSHILHRYLQVAKEFEAKAKEVERQGGSKAQFGEYLQRDMQV